MPRRLPAPLAALLVLALAATLLGLSAAAPSPAVAAPSNDQLVGQQWGLEQIRAPPAWTRSRGAGVTIAILDTGVDLTHPDLAPKLVRGATFWGCANQPDGCGTGSWLDGEDQIADASGHGTHVAGIAAAATNNGIGIAGVAPDARIMPVKVLGGGRLLGDGTAAEVAAGIRWATRNGADVINLSLAGLPGTQALALVGAVSSITLAARDAVRAGVVVVAAAGNDYASICAEPAFDPQVLCVGATDPLGLPATYGNLLLDPAYNVVAAPGGLGLVTCGDDVVSTWPVGRDRAPGCEGAVGRGYHALAGTSMAAPHVSGVAALLLAQGRQPADVPDVLRRTAWTPLLGRGLYDPLYGYGIVDAEAAVAEPLPRVVERVSGPDRVATAAAVSRRAFVLARADEYADALAGAPLAAHLDGPLLLSGRDRLAPATRAEVERLGAREAVLLGGRGALGDGVARDLEAAGLRVRRISGANRFATAAQIASELPAASEVLLTEGANADPARGWPDALSASGLAAARGLPILLATRDALPAETARAIPGSAAVVVVGGRAAVSDAVAAEAGRRGAAVRRIAGADRYATSVAVAEEALRRGGGAATTWVATGRAFADGLVAGAAAGSTGGLMVLIDGRSVDGSAASRDFLAARRGQIRSLPAVGGTGAITPATEARLRQLLD
jgi:putative cell wall-binding protein